MSFRNLKIFLTMLIVVLLAAPVLFAQSSTTGSIEGTVSDNTGAPLPGVTVEVRSAALQGVRSDTTDLKGHFRFTLLPAGSYNVSATLSGFNTVQQQNVGVQLNKTVTLDVRMSAAVQASITVTAAAPVVDVTTAQSGANITAQTLQSLPLARNFTAAAQVAPGVATEQTGPAAGQVTVYGSSGAENDYIVDGLDTTGIAAGLNVKRINMETIAEENVLTGGMPAEYGRLTGGAIVAVTKSGSNEFHGAAFGYDSGGGLQSRPTIAPDVSSSATTITDSGRTNYDIGANLGGFIVRDRVWFFGTYDHQRQTNQSIRVNTPLAVPGFNLGIGGQIPTNIKRELYDAKLTLSLTPNHLLNLSVLGDPSESTGAQFAITGPPSTFNGTNKTGGDDYNAVYTGVFGTRFNVNANYGRHNEKNELGGPGATLALFQDRTNPLGTGQIVSSGGFGSFDNSKYKRDLYKADASTFLGAHTLKIGIDNEKMQTVDNRFYSGGDWIRKFKCGSTAGSACPSGQTVYYRHEVFLNDQAPGFSLTSPSSWLTAIANPLVVVPKTQNNAYYAQDQWKILSNLTLNAGVRYEQQKVGDRFGQWQINLKNNWAPRVGLIWDPTNSGRSRAYVNFGRFFEAIPMDINIREFGGEISLDVDNFNASAGALTPDPALTHYSVAAQRQAFRILGGGTVPVDPNMKAQFVDEYLVGYDFELVPSMMVGVKGTYRNLGRVVEDMLVPSGNDYFVTNPGQGLGAEGGTINGDTVPVPKPTRKYTGVEVHAQKRFSNNYQFYSSYTWSRLKGNYDGTFQSSTGQLDPNINSAYDYADFEVNNSGGGFLSNDRTHMFKLSGSYTVGTGFAHGLEFGLSTHYYTGMPLTAYGYASSYRNWEYYLTPRGSLGRGPADYEADVHAGFPIAAGPTRVTLLLDVFNVLNRQAKTQLDQRYNLSTDPVCAGITADPNFAPGTPQHLCNDDGGIMNAPGGVQPSCLIANPRATATNPSFLKAGTAFTQPRQIRLGARITF